MNRFDHISIWKKLSIYMYILISKVYTCTYLSTCTCIYCNSTHSNYTCTYMYIKYMYILQEYKVHLPYIHWVVFFSTIKTLTALPPEKNNKQHLNLKHSPMRVHVYTCTCMLLYTKDDSILHTQVLEPQIEMQLKQVLPCMFFLYMY